MMDWKTVESIILTNDCAAVRNLLGNPAFMSSKDMVLLKTALLLRRSHCYEESLCVVEMLEKRVSGSELIRVLHLKADIHLDAEEYQDAAACYTLILSSEGTDVTYSNRGLAYWHLHEYSKALADYTRAIEINPDNAIACRGAGEICLKLGQINQAIAYFEKSTAADPGYIDAFISLGIAYYQSEQWVKAYSALLTAQKLDPSNKLASHGIRTIERNFDLC